MARVFLASDVTLDRKVVVKVLAPELAEILSSERFKREVYLAAQLQHPHLVPVLQAGEADGLPYFVMPYVAGESLRARLAGGQPIPRREAVAILRDVARAMSYAHEQGIVHRDIKPDNVLLSSGAAMVTDFGIAKALSSSRSTSSNDTALTRAGSSLGTPTYMAPEQVAADPGADHRVDLYAFGIMAYELLTGRPPFHDRSPQALLTAHLVEAPAPVGERVPEVPRVLADLVMQCLEKDPAKRPETARSIVERLEDLDWSGERAAPPRPRGKRRIAVGAFAVLAVAVVSGWIWTHREPAVARNPQLVTVVPFRVASADPGLHYLREGMLDLLAAKLPGEGGLQATEPRMLLAAWRGAGGAEQLDLSTADAQRLAERLGSGWLLQGDVVGTPSRIILNGALFPAGASEARVRVSVEGPPDSLGSLVDDFVGKLLTSVSGGEASTSLTRTSLPTLRRYLDGVTLLRRGVPASVTAFREAVEMDSTFAPAALGLLQATGWFNDDGLAVRSHRLAWETRKQLGTKDQALILATLGPRYPAPPSTRELFEASQRYLQLAPERADAWYTYADKLYHFGDALGFPDRAARSAEAFQRALAVDSTYVPGYIHLQQLAVELGDSAMERRLHRLREAADTNRYWIDQVRWYRAIADNDSAAIEHLWDSLPQHDNALLYLVARQALFVPGPGIEDGLRAYDSLIARSDMPAAQRNTRFSASSLLLVAGRPRAARAMLEQARNSPDDVTVLTRMVYDAVVGEGDTTGVVAALAQLQRLASAVRSRDSAVAGAQRAASRALLAWKLSQGDTSGTRPLFSHLLAGPGLDRTEHPPTLDRIMLTALEALLAERQGRSDAPARALQLDSLLEHASYAEFNVARMTYASMVAARLLEKYQSPAAALRAVRRRAVWWTNEMPYLAAQLREEGRLAALAGANEEAILAYRHYVALRSSPEAEQRPELDQVRRELERLELGRKE